MLFDFVVTHRDKLVVPEDAEQFSLSPNTWDEFVAFVAQFEDVPYASRTYQAFEALQKQAAEELLDKSNTSALAKLQQGLEADVARDLAQHREEIEQALNQELVAHLYNTTGEYRHGLKHDPVANRAVDLLESEAYVSILQGPGMTE